MGRRRKRGLFNMFGSNRRSNWRLDDIRMGGGLNWNVSPETKQGVFIIILFSLSALSLLGIFGLYGESNFGIFILKILSWLFGDLQWIFPVITALFGYFLLRREKYEVKAVNCIGAILLILGLTGLWHLKFDAFESVHAAKAGLGGGFSGLALSYPLLKLMDFWGSLVVGITILLVGLLLTFETSIYGLTWPVRLFKFLLVKINGLSLAAQARKASRRERVEEEYEEESEAPEPEEEKEEEAEEPQFKKTAVAEIKEEESIAKPKRFGRKIELPLSLLKSRSGKPTSGDVRANQEIIKRTLANFGIELEMADVNIGPTVTQYTFRPADGVKLSRIIALNNDLSLALAAHPIRIEAPIPGKSLVGVEIPNKLAAKVTMNELLSSKEFKSRGNNLAIALGKDVSGKPCFGQLDRMPHLLIAGATGSGKSVCINSVIISLLYQNSPDELKFILVDPKRVELPLYNGIPYLLTPVITDVKKTINALKWTVVEMEKRFELLSKKGARNISIYNQNASPSDRLPYIVFIIDELADLMSTAASDVEGGIVRLAQMARAVGIHLILATQRPSVEVITGLIKANIPGRIAFSVASLIDSRTILDCSGAEKLVGRGDMLYLGPEISKPKRIQGVFLTDEEIGSVIRYIKDQGEAEYIDGLVEKPGIMGFGSDGYNGDGDPLLTEAVEIIRQSGKASASLLQRRLKLGYARAARILDLLEDQGVIGAADGAKPREVFLDKLGGVGAVEFAAREHDLTGELKPFVEDEEEFEEVEDDFDDGGAKVVFKDEAEQFDEALEEISEDEELETEVEKAEEFAEVAEETEKLESLEAEEETEEEDEELEVQEKEEKSKKKFDNDEWT